jgi:hypothetical protein
MVILFRGMTRVSSVNIMYRYGPDDRAIGVLSPAEAKDCSSYVCCVQTGSGAHPAPLSNEYRRSFPRGLGVTLTNYPHPVLRTWMSRSYTSSLPWSSIAVLRDCCYSVVVRGFDVVNLQNGISNPFWMNTGSAATLMKTKEYITWYK